MKLKKLLILENIIEKYRLIRISSIFFFIMGTWTYFFPTQISYYIPQINLQIIEMGGLLIMLILGIAPIIIINGLKLKTKK